MNKWLFDRILMALVAALLVHTIVPSQEYLVQFTGAILGLVAFETTYYLVRSIK